MSLDAKRLSRSSRSTRVLRMRQSSEVAIHETLFPPTSCSKDHQVGVIVQFHRDYVPIFDIGTGKTTTARKMGQVYYDMGFLSSPEVIECSASDLVGQYVGQTGPKTKAIFEKALG